MLLHMIPESHRSKGRDIITSPKTKKSNRTIKMPPFLCEEIITRDYGFAPNPFWNICSLATCKPQIRERALKGDWVAGFGGAKTTIARKMVFLMQVDEICTFDEYWEDSRFFVKRPRFDGNYQQCYGDNIYYHIGGERMQENSHHSYADGINQNTDDIILREYKFTNAYRASDRVSQYLIKNVIYQSGYTEEDTIFRVLFFKTFNNIETWEKLENTFGSLNYRNFEVDQ